MKTAPKSVRLHIGLFGRTNVGKSSLLNYVAGQDVAITSEIPGTTTDVVEKPMELLPIGPVVFLDTAGLDDVSALAQERIERTQAALLRTDIALLVLEPDQIGDVERNLLRAASEQKIPVVSVVNKTDTRAPSEAFLAELKSMSSGIVCVSTRETEARRRDQVVTELKERLLEVCPEDVLKPPPLLADLVPASGLVVLVVPIDLQAPKGRLILPQVQTIRDALDLDASALVVKERELTATLDLLKVKPSLVVCDSQVVQKVVAETPKEIPCTTFSILFSRSRGDLVAAARGVRAISRLAPTDRILVAEACSHHAAEDDIGRVKIPRWLRRFTGHDLNFDVASGFDYPRDLDSYKLVVHCGGCMLNRRHMLSRIARCQQANVPITNYGVCISYVQGVLPRVLAPFPTALSAFQSA